MQIIEIRQKERSIRFACPICRNNSICDIEHMSIPKNVRTQEYLNTESYMLVCRACNQGSIWKQFQRKNNFNFNLRLIDPITSPAPLPANDMPEAVKKDYEEARLVSMYSSRASAALLRLGLQKLCKHLGESGEHLDTDIRSLAKRPEIGVRLIQAADTLRIVGNNAVHPGEMNEEDIDNVSDGLFNLLNLIVTSAITEPNKWDVIYQSLPEKPREAAEKKDGRS
jgi:hypothetical protein